MKTQKSNSIVFIIAFLNLYVNTSIEGIIILYLDKKNKMYKLLMAIFLYFLSGTCFSQDITISNGNKTKKFKSNSIFVVTILDETVKDEDCECYDHTHLTGTITSISKDSIVMEVTKIETSKNVGKSQINNTVNLKESSLKNTIAIQDISSFKNFRTEKSMRKKSASQIFGTVSFLGSVGSLIGILLVPEQENKFKLAMTSAILITNGIIFVASGGTKTYKLKDVADPWRF